ncbi:OmpA family protein [Flavobacterium sp.]
MIRSFFTLIFMCPILAFSQKELQYPDAIIDAYNTFTKKSDVFYGGNNAGNGFVVPLSYLLYNNDYFVSLPTGSFVILGFTDNYIEDAPNQNDIFIREEGGAGEFGDVFVSSDNVEYTFLGTAGNGEINEFDLATINYKKQVKYIKILGKDSKGASPGFDVGNVYGLPGASKPEKAILLENVWFETNQSVLLTQSFASLDKLVAQLKENPETRIAISGYTDNVGSDDKNQVLSEQRAKSVLNYLVSQGIDSKRLSHRGFGSSQPIASNETKEGRSQNRRVTFSIIE